MRWADVVVTTMSTLACLYLITEGRWLPGWEASAVTFGVMALGPPVLRALTLRYPKILPLRWAAAFWLLPCIALGHGALKPLVDGLNSRLMDSYLAQADLRIFGFFPGKTLGSYTPGWFNDFLMLCYYSYFFWPLALGLVLYVRKRKEFSPYTSALALLFACNFVSYILVPAIGPRLYLSHEFPTPLSGTLTPYLESVMREPVFMKDCFPSGHTATTLLVLMTAWKHARRFFWVMLPIGSGLILATLVGRFHYGVDVLCAVPFVLAVSSVSELLTRLSPRGLLLTAQGFALLGRRQPARA